jgi:hypothetical protein
MEMQLEEAQRLDQIGVQSMRGQWARHWGLFHGLASGYVCGNRITVKHRALPVQGRGRLAFLCNRAFNETATNDGPPQIATSTGREVPAAPALLVSTAVVLAKLEEMDMSKEVTTHQRNAFWAEVLETAGGLSATPVGLLAGAAKALDGGSFEQGFTEVVDSCAHSCKEFGAAHGDEINKSVLLGVASGIGIMFGKDAYAAVRRAVR